MRDIKFRVWNKKSKKFLDSFDGEGSGSFLCLYGKLFDSYFDIDDQYQCNIDLSFEVENFVIQQYTGLKDKNGIEIYEGDIVSCSPIIEVEYKEKCCEGVFPLKKFKGIIEYFSDLCSFKIIDIMNFNHGSSLRKNNDYLYEIIGNILENPELLKNV